MSLIFKICLMADWKKPEHIHEYQGSPKDRADGFLHFSTAEQLSGTLEKYYADASEVLLVAVNPTALGPALKYEPSRDGELFPHLYAPLSYDHVKWVKLVSRGETGRFVLPVDMHN